MRIAVNATLPGRSSSSQYQVVEYLGSGGFGEVYKVIDAIDSSIRAIKILRPDLIRHSPEAVRILEREATAALQIDHPHVVKVFDYHKAELEEGDTSFLVMEYIEGGDLRERLRQAQQTGAFIEQTMLLDWMDQLAQGLAAINQRLVHRDLKPENVLIDGDVLKISDFGLSKYVEEATRTLTFKGMGTPLYMAPESWELQRITVATDIYSLGVMFYELSTLEPPFRGANFQELRHRHLFGEIPHVMEKRPELGDVIDGMIRKMMAKSPRDRYQSATDVITILHQERAAGPAPRVPGQLAELVAKARQRHDALMQQRYREQLEAEARNELARLVEYQARELIKRMDGLVAQINQQLQEKPIDILPPYLSFCVGNMEARIYRYYQRELVLGFFSVPLEIPQQITDRGIAAAGFLYLREDKEPREGMNLLLIEQAEDLYGEWKACPAKGHALSRIRYQYEPYGFLDAQELLENLVYHWGNVMHVHVLEVKTLTDEEILAWMEKLVA